VLSRSPGTEKRREHLIIGHGGSGQPVSWCPSALLLLVLLPPLLLLVLFAICMPAFGSQ
jgi:hypothetical protein